MSKRQLWEVVRDNAGNIVALFNTRDETTHNGLIAEAMNCVEKENPAGFKRMLEIRVAGPELWRMSSTYMQYINNGRHLENFLHLKRIQYFFHPDGLPANVEYVGPEGRWYVLPQANSTWQVFSNNDVLYKQEPAFTAESYEAALVFIHTYVNSVRTLVGSLRDAKTEAEKEAARAAAQRVFAFEKPEEENEDWQNYWRSAHER